MGDAVLAAAAKAIAYRLDPHAVVDRAARAAGDRTVTIRPAPDTMTYVTALLPVAQGVSVFAALMRAAGATCDGRSRGQVMADTMVERITGRPADQPVPVAVSVVLSDQALLGAENGPAVVAGYGSVPAPFARNLIAAAVTDSRSQAALCRLYSAPASGALVTMESRSRTFPKALAEFIGLRDQRSERHTAARRSGTTTTPSRIGGVVQPAPTTGSASARRATTRKRRLAGL